MQISLNDTADEHVLEVAWTCGNQRAELLCDLKAMSFQARALCVDAYIQEPLKYPVS